MPGIARSHTIVAEIQDHVKHKLGAHDYHLFRFTNVDGRCPCTRDQRVLCFSRFLKSSEESSYPISQPLQLEPL